MKIRTKVGLFPITLAIIMLSGALLVTLTVSNSIIRGQAENKLLIIAQSRAHSIETLLNDYKDIVHILAVGIPFTNVVDPQIDDTRRITECNLRIERTIEINPYISRIEILNKNGIAVASSNKDIELDESKKTVFVKGKENIYVSGMHKSVHTGNLVLSISAPIYVRDMFSGVLIVSFDIENKLFEIMANRIGLGETGEIFLVNKDGYIISPSKFIDNMILETKINTRQVNLFILEHIEKGFSPEKKEIATIYINQTGKKVLGIHRFISEMQWGLIAEFDVNEAYKLLYKQTALLIILFLVLLIITIIVTAVISRSITLPIVKLHKGTEEIINGNLDYKVSLESNDELGQFSRSFDIMTDRLKKTKNELKNYTEGLETTIEKRTVELEKQIKKSEKQRIAALVLLNDLNESTRDLRTEITEREQLQKQLLHSQKIEAVGRLAGGVAHDFNNMLSVILGFTELAQRQIGSSHKIFKNLEAIRKAAKRSASLTRQLLAFSRKQTLEPKVIDLNNLLKNLEKMLRRLIGEDIDFMTAYMDNLDYVEVDPGQIEQVAINLAVNARDAMPGGGKLTIETANVNLDEHYGRTHLVTVPGQYVMLAVSDTGCGMDEETRSRVFEPFFTTKETGKGTGLGLSTVYGIVKQSRGYIWCYSEPNKGTTFKIYLPRTDARPDLKTERDKTPVSRGGEEHILVVEDEANVRNMLESVLKELHYRVTIAGDGEDALHLIKKKGLCPDLIIADVVMPRMGGKLLIEQVRKILPGQKVLYMSGYTDNAIVHQGILDPGTPFIHKPFTFRAISAKVKQVLSEKGTKPDPGT